LTIEKGKPGKFHENSFKQRMGTLSKHEISDHRHRKIPATL